MKKLIAPLIITLMFIFGAFASTPSMTAKNNIENKAELRALQWRCGTCGYLTNDQSHPKCCPTCGDSTNWQARSI